MEGYIFDFKRFAMHDGKGIRTTIFFKGCPLRCVWCQNPEGLAPQPQIVYMENTCLHCGCCVKASQEQGVTLRQNTICVQREAKEDWAKLVDACPTRSLRLDAASYTVEEVVRIACKDAPFFAYGGGVTISGGEPFYQPAFLLAILQALKAQGIHTALETSLYTSRETLMAVLPYVDQLYADIKLYDAALHQRYCGVDNALILENIAYVLAQRPQTTIIRTPLIPHMSATQDNIHAIASFLAACSPDVSYELLNYNPLAKAKYAMVGKTYCFEDNPKLYREAEMERFYDMARQAGIHNLIKEV